MTTEVTTTETALLDGSLEDVPEVASKIVRVFLSSTFSDMAEERNILLQDIYPKIQEYCKTKYGVNFQMVDMRWGVTNEVQNDHMTSTCCLKEIKNCQNVSLGPNFVALMGQKYGYRPIPAIIEASEFELLRQLLDENGKNDLSTLDVWYLKDSNTVPAQYVLQPIDSVLKNYDSMDEGLKKASRTEWQDTFEDLRELLMTGAELAYDKGLLGGQDKEKYFNSVTQEEIEAGLLHGHDNPNLKCLCFMRDIEDLEENINHHRAAKFLDLLPVENGRHAEVDTDAQERLQLLKDVELPKRLNKQNIVKLKTTWANKGGINTYHNADYLNKMAKAFYERVTWLVDENLASKDLEEDEQTREIRQSLLYRNNWSKLFFGRNDILGALERYLTESSKMCPFVVYGESGTGKTALIAKCAKEVRTWVASNPVVMVRFLGSSPQTSHILLLLKSICRQICGVYNYPAEGLTNDYKELVNYFHSLLQKVEFEKRPLVLLLDSIDQLSSSFEPYTFQWLPKILPKHVKIVMSFIPSVHNLLKRFNVYASKIRHFTRPIPPLGNILCMDIIRARLADSGRTISAKQTEVMKDMFLNCSLPLYSRVMLDEILTWKSYTVVTTNMVSSTLKEALNHFFKRLEIHHGKLLVRHALAYITASREGLSEMELLDLLSLDDEVLNSIFLFWLPPVRRLPPFLWTRLRIELDQFLVEREADGIAVLNWYHRLFQEAAKERYLVDDESSINIHSNLSDYFLGSWSGRSKPFRFSLFLKNRLALTYDQGEEDRRVPEMPLIIPQSAGRNLFHKRKLTELPFHLIKSRRFDEMKDTCVFNYNWMWTKITAFGLQMLLEDLELLLDEDSDPEVQSLTDTLRIAGTTLNDHPENLSLEISGRLLDFMDSMSKIKNLIKDCDKKAVKHISVIAPFQMYEAPVSSLTRAIDGMPNDVGDTILIRNDSKIVAMCLDGTVQALDCNGTVEHEVSLHKLHSISIQDMGLYASRDEKYIICESRPASKYIYVLDAETLEIIHEHKMSSSNLYHNIVVSKNYVCLDNAVFNLHSGDKVYDLTKYRKITIFVQLAISMCEKFIMIGGQNVVYMYNIQTKKRVKDLKIPHTPNVIDLTSDGRLAVIGTTVDCVIKLFDVCEESKTFGTEITTYNPLKSFSEIKMTEDIYATNEVSEICISNKEGAFVSLVKRKYPIVWSLKNVSNKPRLLNIPTGSGPFRYLFKVQFTADDRFILAAELSPTVMMWDSVTGDLVASLVAHENDIHDLVIGRFDSMAVTVQQNAPNIKIWDLQKVLTMEKLSSVKELDLSVKNVSLLNENNLVFLSRVFPPKGSKAYHYIDFFGIEALNFATGKTQTVLPYDKYGSVQSITSSKDASILLINTGNARSSTISVVNLKQQRFVKSITTDVCDEAILSWDGGYMCLLLSGDEPGAKIYTVPDLKEIVSYKNCFNGIFTKNGTFIGITGRQLMVRENMNDDETSNIKLPGDVVALHYAEVIDILLVSVDDGFQLIVIAFKTIGYGVIGTITDVSKTGISDVADNGSICIDSDLKIFELERCKQLKKLLPNRKKSTISSVRLSSKGQHALFIDSYPEPCVKVCRVKDSCLVAQCFLHCIPEMLEVVPKLNVIVVVGKESKKLFVLALCDHERQCRYDSCTDRLHEILSVKSGNNDQTSFELCDTTKEKMKSMAKSQQTKHIYLTERQQSYIYSNGRRKDGPDNNNTSSSCKIL